MQERLQKLIAQAGIASRRGAEELIEAGEVTVNGDNHHRTRHESRPRNRPYQSPRKIDQQTARKTRERLYFIEQTERLSVERG